uniref:Uncharacterized protein n=1 Tax=Noccaea caerulescens TaxID=107243 RepID=A0A1J3E584_NOCCA
MAVSKMRVVVRTKSSSPPLGSKPVLPEGPIVFPGNTDEVGIPLVAVPLIGIPVVELPVDGGPLVEFPVDGAPIMGVPVEPELDKQLEAFEGGEVEMKAAPLKSQVAPVGAFF